MSWDTRMDWNLSGSLPATLLLNNYFLNLIWGLKFNPFCFLGDKTYCSTNICLITRLGHTPLIWFPHSDNGSREQKTPLKPIFCFLVELNFPFPEPRTRVKLEQMTPILRLGGFKQKKSPANFLKDPKASDFLGNYKRQIKTPNPRIYWRQH